MVIRTQNSTQFTVLTWSSSFSGLIPFRMDLYMFECVCVSDPLARSNITKEKTPKQMMVSLSKCYMAHSNTYQR